MNTLFIIASAIDDRHGVDETPVCSLVSGISRAKGNLRGWGLLGCKWGLWLSKGNFKNFAIKVSVRIVS